MTSIRQLSVVAVACFRPTSTRTIIGVSAYCAYLVWLANRGIDSLAETAHLYTCFPLAIAGSWIGAGVLRVAGWAGSHFTPGLPHALGLIAILATLSALGLQTVVVLIAGLEPRPLFVWGLLAIAAGLVCGERPSLTSYLVLLLAILVSLGPLLQTRALLPASGVSDPAASVAALATTTVMVARFVVRLRNRTMVSPSFTNSWAWARATAKHLASPLWEPSLSRVALWSAALAAGCTVALRLPPLEWRDGPLIVVVATVCANISASGSSVALPSGPLPRAAWILLTGIANTRFDAARRAMWRIVHGSMFAAGVFTAITIALGPDWHLVEMMLLALAACHTYLVLASRSRWLLSSRLSALVATPVVVALAGVAWTYVSWGLVMALVVCLSTAIAAVYLGGLGMARVNLDIPQHTNRTL